MRLCMQLATNIGINEVAAWLCFMQSCLIVPNAWLQDHLDSDGTLHMMDNLNMIDAGVHHTSPG